MIALFADYRPSLCMLRCLALAAIRIAFRSHAFRSQPAGTWTRLQALPGAGGERKLNFLSDLSANGVITICLDRTQRVLSSARTITAQVSVLEKETGLVAAANPGAFRAGSPWQGSKM
jgi:hypothetical protein